MKKVIFVLLALVMGIQTGQSSVRDDKNVSSMQNGRSTSGAVILNNWGTGLYPRVRDPFVITWTHNVYALSYDLYSIVEENYVLFEMSQKVEGFEIIHGEKVVVEIIDDYHFKVITTNMYQSFRVRIDLEELPFYVTYEGDDVLTWSPDFPYYPQD